VVVVGRNTDDSATAQGDNGSAKESSKKTGLRRLL
jgi:hypothetical protein